MDDFLGQGLKYPFQFSAVSGGAETSTATAPQHAHLHESMRQILGTRRGERFMRPEFGSRLDELLFEGNDAILSGLLRHEIVDALTRWEPRIVVTDVEITPDAHQLTIDVRYQIIASQVAGNYVFPFYRGGAV